MKNVIIVAVLILAASVCFAQTPGQFLIYAEAHGLTTSGDLIPHCFFVDDSELQNATAWHPNEALPLGLGIESRKAAASILAKDQTCTNLELHEVEIRRCILPQTMFAYVQPGNTNLWFVVFTFTTDKLGPIFTAVETIDGVFANEHSITPKAMAAAFNSKEGAFDVRSSSGRNIDPSYLTHLDSPDFKVPAKQWDPSSGECPIAFHDFLQLASTWLHGDSQAGTNQLVFNSFVLNSYFPLEAANAQHMDALSNLHHWFCKMDFTTEDEAHEYDVYLSLDGTILQTYCDGQAVASSTLK